ncbi:hypothetical protein G9A89_006576 [Geosiphon pyriformis]|nr:hypothetical protein G9A89_006576 [Geosiphon pyriformis]
MPKASAIPSNLTIPPENLETKPKTETGIEPSTGISNTKGAYKIGNLDASNLGIMEDGNSFSKLSFENKTLKKRWKDQKLPSKKTYKILKPNNELNHQLHKKTHDQISPPHHNTNTEHSGNIYHKRTFEQPWKANSTKSSLSKYERQ